MADAEDQFAGPRHEFVHGGRLIYAWHQSVSAVYVEVPTPPGVRARDVACEFSPRQLVLGLAGNPPYVKARPRCFCGRRVELTRGRCATGRAVPQGGRVRVLLDTWCAVRFLSPVRRPLTAAQPSHQRTA